MVTMQDEFLHVISVMIDMEFSGRFDENWILLKFLKYQNCHLHCIVNSSIVYLQKIEKGSSFKKYSKVVIVEIYVFKNIQR